LKGSIAEDEKVVEKPNYFPSKHAYQTNGSKDSDIKKRKNLHLVDIECYIWILRQNGINSFIFKRSFSV